MVENSDSKENFSKQVAKDIRIRTKRELGRIQSDLDNLTSKNNVFHNARILYYGPTFILMFASYFSLFLLKDNFDVVNVTIAAYLIYCIHRLMHWNFTQLDGNNGRLDFHGDRIKKLEDEILEGISLDSSDIINQAYWLDSLKKGRESQVKHVFEEKVGEIRNKIRRYRYRISILVPTLVLSFLLKELPWDIEGKSESTWLNFFSPEYLQWVICPSCDSNIRIWISLGFILEFFCVFFGSISLFELAIDENRNDSINKDIV